MGPETPVVTGGKSMVARESEQRTGQGPKLASPHLPFLTLPSLVLFVGKNNPNIFLFFL